METLESVERLPRKIGFDEVQRVFEKEHDSSPEFVWALNLLSQANDFYEGEWHEVEITPSAAREHVTLMYHHHPLEGLPLVPKTGATVSETAERFREIEHDYHEHNAGCCSHIRELGDSAFSPIFLASNQVEFRIPDQYQTELILPKENFLHLDGLHRLIAWELAGRFEENAYSKGKKLRVYIAGPFSGFSD